MDKTLEIKYNAEKKRLPRGLTRRNFEKWLSRRLPGHRYTGRARSFTHCPLALWLKENHPGLRIVVADTILIGTVRYLSPPQWIFDYFVNLDLRFRGKVKTDKALELLRALR